VNNLYDSYPLVYQGKKQSHLQAVSEVLDKFLRIRFSSVNLSHDLH